MRLYWLMDNLMNIHLCFIAARKSSIGVCQRYYPMSTDYLHLIMSSIGIAGSRKRIFNILHVLTLELCFTQLSRILKTISVGDKLTSTSTIFTTLVSGI